VIDRIRVAISFAQDGPTIGIDAITFPLASNWPVPVEILIGRRTFAALFQHCERQDEIAGEFALNVEVPLICQGDCASAGNPC